MVAEASADLAVGAVSEAAAADRAGDEKRLGAMMKLEELVRQLRARIRERTALGGALRLRCRGRAQPEEIGLQRSGDRRRASAGETSRGCSRIEGVGGGRESAAADVHAATSGGHRPTSSRWSTRTFWSGIACCSETPPFDGIKCRPSDLRLQVEQQTMGKLLQLRQATMGAGGDARLQLEVLEKSLSTLMVIFRGISRLHGQVPSQDYEELTRQLARAGGFFSRSVRQGDSSRSRDGEDSAGECRRRYWKVIWARWSGWWLI